MGKNEDNQDKADKKVEQYGQITLENDNDNTKIQLITIIGEIEGHEMLPATSKSTKYEHLLPQTRLY